MIPNMSPKVKERGEMSHNHNNSSHGENKTLTPLCASRRWSLEVKDQHLFPPCCSFLEEQEKRVEGIGVGWGGTA